MSDYIKREDALESVTDQHYSNDITKIEKKYKANPYSSTSIFEETLLDIYYDIINIQSADVIERKTGKWKGHGMFCVQCDQCERWTEMRTPYCAHCGAEMEE